MVSDAVCGMPVSASERILFIDVLRGTALFGILAANMRAYCTPLETLGTVGLLFHGRIDQIVQELIDVFVSGKFLTLFSLLFGLGFAMQMSRAEARQVRFMGFYPRRLLALALFGLIHGIFIWPGDILLTYAFSGSLLLMFRKHRQKTLLWWAGILLSVPVVLVGLVLGLSWYGIQVSWLMPAPPDMNGIQSITNVYANGSVRQIFAQNWTEWTHIVPYAVLLVPYTLGLFLLGMWVCRAGIVQKLREYRPALKQFCMWCLPIGIALNVYVVLVPALVPPDKVSWWVFSAALLSSPSQNLLGVAYAAALALIFLNERRRPLLARFAAVGRMALTNYLTESVVCTLFFYHYTTGLYGRVGPAASLLITVILFSAQVAFSNWWIGHLKFGPVEWLWRGMTYGRFPSMTREDSRSASG